MKALFDSVLLPLAVWICCFSTHAEALYLQVSKSTNSQIRIEWVGGGILEFSDRLDQGWKELSGNPASPVLVKTTERTAFFRLKLRVFPLSVTSIGAGAGTIRSEPPGIDCGADCQEGYLEGTVVRLTAQPSQGSTFDGWSGAANGTDEAVLVMDEPKTVTANFARAPVSALINGDFEQGPQIGWLQYPGYVIYRAAELGIPVVSGEYVARLGYDRDDRAEAGIGQELILPAVHPLYLVCSIWIVSEEICDPPWWDTIGFYVNYDPIEENTRICHSNGPTGGWRRVSFDLSAYAGQPVLLGFAISGGTLSSALYLDDVALSQIPE